MCDEREMSISDARDGMEWISDYCLVLSRVQCTSNVRQRGGTRVLYYLHASSRGGLSVEIWSGYQGRACMRCRKYQYCGLGV